MSEDQTPSALRAWRLSAYDGLRRRRPDRFANPPGAAYEIVCDPGAQAQVAGQSAEWNRARGVPEQYADIGVVYQDPFIALIRDAVRFRSGGLGAYIRSLPADDTVTAGAAVLAVHGGKVILIRHFRHASRGWHWEIPRGFGTAGEDREATARREVSEELGAKVLALVALGHVSFEGGVPGDLPQVFWAEVTEPRQLEAEEGIDEMIAVTPAGLDEMIAAGQIDDAFTLAAVSLARARGLITWR